MNFGYGGKFKMIDLRGPTSRCMDFREKKESLIDKLVRVFRKYRFERKAGPIMFDAIKRDAGDRPTWTIKATPIDDSVENILRELHAMEPVLATDITDGLYYKAAKGR